MKMLVMSISWDCLALVCLLLRGSYALQKSPCDSLVPEYCGLPYPNSYFTESSSETSTGVKLNLSSRAFPTNSLGISVDPKMWNNFDGFSPFPSILTYFADLSDSNLPPHWRMADSLAEDCATVLIDAHTGERLAHFAELDSVENVRTSRRALMLWPSRRLLDASRYIVALRYLRSKRGNLVEPSETFRVLRDKVNTSDPEIESRKEHFEDIFLKLSSAGVRRETLQLAWDFTTASLDSLTGRLLFVRDDAFSRLSAGGATYTINRIQDNYNDHIYRRIQGYLDVPLYLTSPLPGSELVINSSTNLPVFQRLTPVKFTILVPQSIANSSQSAPPLLLQYGHGLFGDQGEAETDYLVAQANAHGYILFASDWWGMAQYDVPAIAAILNLDPSRFNVIPDRLTQGMVNALVLMRTMKGNLHKDKAVTIGGKVRIDPSLSHYYGNSLGGIMGEVYMASTQDVTRGVLGVAGGPFMLLLPRSSDFAQFEVDLRVLHPDPVDFILSMSQWGVVWSRLDPNAYMSSIGTNPLKGSPSHRVLYHYALGDAQVNLLGLYSIARSSDALIFESNIHGRYAFKNGSGLVEDHLYGLSMIGDEVTVTEKYSVAMGFDFGAPPEPRGNTPPDGNHDTHEKPRRSPLAQQQIDSFLRHGSISNVCKGACKIPTRNILP